MTMENESDSKVCELEVLLQMKIAELDWHDKRLFAIMVTNMDGDDPKEYY